jgi:iron complex transport system substrate-binding protein
MKCAFFFNSAAVCAAVSLSLLAVSLAPSPYRSTPEILDAPLIGSMFMPDGRRAVMDARGTLVPVLPYSRIISAGLVADALVAELCEPQHIVAVSRFSNGPQSFKLGDKPRIDGLGDLERIISLKPDLVLASSYGSSAESMERLREAGIQVFDLGDARGVTTFFLNAKQIGALLDVPSRTRRFVDAFERSLRGIAAGLPANTPKPRCLFVAAVGDQLYGGTVGTSYHDVFVYAGVADGAEGHYRDWPTYSAETILALNPDFIVTKHGMADALRRIPGLDRLPACLKSGGIIELDGNALEDPGILLIDAAAELHRKVYKAGISGQ